MSFGEGLRHVPTKELEALLRAIHRGRLSPPLTKVALFSMGLNACADAAGPLVGLDEDAVRAILVCVLAERRPPVPR